MGQKHAHGEEVLHDGSSRLEMSGFSEFFNEMNLMDLRLLGRHFTWYHANGRAMSRIDR
ncbi:reverse transcriptase, partial [Trifolium medium]|nr:reverse transcriptase [Trifolium medium]